MSDPATVVVGGTRGLGLAIARHYARQGPVAITGRDAEKAAAQAAEISDSARGLGLDLTHPERIAPALADTGPVKRLVLSAIDRGSTSVAEFDIAQAAALATQKMVGYVEVVHALRPRLEPDAAIVIFGGQARVRPYPGSTMVSTVNGGVTGMVRTLSVELAPVRVNALHPGIVGDSPFWAEKPAEVLEAFRSGTLTGRLATTQDVVDATAFLLDNPAVNGMDLVVDGGWR
jgi:NAD(P)-dependent dehydrogenase (short-subunit alcohol dehydrogenase family)